jgi:hypothetical protein
METDLRKPREVFGQKKQMKKKPLSFYTQLSRFERYKTITAAPSFSSLAHFLWHKVYEFDGNCCYLLGGFRPQYLHEMSVHL